MLAPLARFSRPFFLGLLLTVAEASDRAAEATRPVWLAGNGFHTSLALRTRDVPFAAEILSDPHAGIVLIGWGAGDFYRGKTDLCTALAALSGLSPSLLHVVPVRGPLEHRFSHSDIIRLDLPAAHVRQLAAGLDRAFARDVRGRRIAAGNGYYPESRFFAGRERFYFPRMCNTWVAQRLRHDGGVPIFLPATLTAGGLLRQVEPLGRRASTRRRPVDAF